ncbi:hypothetical protein ACJX0J_024215, partial [Zea mays]
ATLRTLVIKMRHFIDELIHACRLLFCHNKMQVCFLVWDQVIKQFLYVILPYKSKHDASIHIYGIINKINIGDLWNIQGHGCTYFLLVDATKIISQWDVLKYRN